MYALFQCLNIHFVFLISICVEFRTDQARIGELFFADNNNNNKICRAQESVKTAAHCATNRSAHEHKESMQYIFQTIKIP